MTRRNRSTTRAAARPATDRPPPVPRPALTVIHPNAAGIDVHSDMHMVCVPAERVPPATATAERGLPANVRRFGANSCDLAAIAEGVIEELDLAAIIRGSTETMAAETVDGIRVQGLHADRFVARVVDRTLHRRNGEGASTDPHDPVEDES